MTIDSVSPLHPMYTAFSRRHWEGAGGWIDSRRLAGLWDAALRVEDASELRVEQLVERGSDHVAVGAARRIERHLVEGLHVVQLQSLGHALLLAQVHPVRLVQDLMHTHAHTLPTASDWLSRGSMSCSTQNRSSLRRFPKPISWLCIEKKLKTKPNAQQKHPFTNQKKCTTTHTHIPI